MADTMKDIGINTIYTGVCLLLAFFIAWIVKFVTTVSPNVIDAGVFGAVFVGLMLAKVAEIHANKLKKS